MINHARTLLLNQPGKNYTPGFLGEEYTPANYVPVSVPSYVVFPRKILFGTDPDKVFLNFRARELMGLIHATELAEFVYSFDPRVTYWPEDRNEFFSAPTALAINKTAGYTRAKIYTQGQPTADNNRGRVFNDYVVQLLEDSGNISAAINSVSSFDAATQPLTFAAENSNLSNKVQVPNSGLSLQFSDLDTVTAESLLLEEFDYELLTQDYSALTLEAGDILPFSAPPVSKLVLASDSIMAAWQLQTYARPSPAIKICLPKLELLGEPLFLELFGVRNDIEPYVTFKNIWFDHPAPNYRLAAFVLAMIYRTAESQR